ncbi:MAG: hypothetical protein R3C15_20885 [Thermoleophilia bacterium]
MEGAVEVPDAIEPVVAWRAWAVVPDGLAALHADAVWRPRAPARATCARGHRAPDPACTCGLYAARSPRALTDYAFDLATGVVIGRVKLWGRIVEATGGYRAELSYPAALFALRPLPEAERLELELLYSPVLFGRRVPVPGRAAWLDGDARLAVLDRFDVPVTVLDERMPLRALERIAVLGERLA